MKRLAGVLLICSTACGCTSLCCLPHECATMIDSIPSCDCMAENEPCCPLCSRPCHCDICQSGGLCPRVLHQRELLIAVGPPAIRYRPAMPPEFLPVPARPVFANVNTAYPPETRGVVEQGYGPELTVQSSD